MADIHTSRTDANTVFAVFNNHKEGDFKPYILKSNNKGKTWDSISSNLPKGEYAWTIYQDHKDANILFVGTELGLYFSINGGNEWHKFRSGIPTISIRDLEIHPEENDLIAASFGRGFYILDDYSALRELNVTTLSKETHLFPIKDALLFVEKNPDGNALGHAFYTSPNPDFGATFTYFVKNKTPAMKQQRLASEEEKRTKKEPVYYPDWKDFAAERREASPQLVFSISNKENQIIRRLTAPLKKGLHRINWDLRSSDGLNGAVALVPPGTYSVQMAKVVNGKWEDLGISKNFEVVPLHPKNISPTQQQATATFQQQVFTLNRSIVEADEELKNAIDKTKSIQKALLKHPNSKATFYEQTITIQDQLQDLKMVLNGNSLMVEKMELIAPSIKGRLNRVKWNMYNTTEIPTDSDKENYQIALDEFHVFQKSLQAVSVKQLSELEQRLKQLGIFYKN